MTLEIPVRAAPTPTPGPTVRPAPKGRGPIHPDITEDMIEQLVRAFYARVRAHKELGPIFEAVIPEDWEPHLRTMMDFWSSVTLMTGRFKGTPMVKHKALTGVTPEHFEIWLALFRETAAEVCPEPVAAIFIARAERIAESLKLGMFGVPLPAA